MTLDLLLSTTLVLLAVSVVLADRRIRQLERDVTRLRNAVATITRPGWTGDLLREIEAEKRKRGIE